MLHLTNRQSREIVFEDSEDFTIIYDRIIGQTRWSVNHEIVIQHNKTKKYYLADYYIGATERNDEQPFEYSNPNWVEVKPVEKVVICYDPVGE